MGAAAARRLRSAFGRDRGERRRRRPHVFDRRKLRGSRLLADREGARRHDLELAIVDDEFEQLVDRGDVLVGGQFDPPGEIGAVGIELVEKRQRSGVARDRDVAHAREFAQQPHGLVALAIEIGHRREFDRVARHLRFGELGLVVDAQHHRLKVEDLGLPTALAAAGPLVRFVGEAFQLVDQRVHARFVDRLVGPSRLHQIRQDVGRAKHRLQDGGRRRELLAADEIESRFESVRETHQAIELERSRAALDRMHRAKHCVDRLGIGVAFIHREQADLELAELLLALLEEGLPDRRHRVH